jgi:hypothetical protein
LSQNDTKPRTVRHFNAISVCGDSIRTSWTVGSFRRMPCNRSTGFPGAVLAQKHCSGGPGDVRGRRAVYRGECARLCTSIRCVRRYKLAFTLVIQKYDWSRGRNVRSSPQRSLIDFVIPREGSFFDFCHPDGSAASSTTLSSRPERSEAEGSAVSRQRCQVWDRRSPRLRSGQALRLHSDATRPLFTQDDNWKGTRLADLDMPTQARKRNDKHYGG